MAEVRLLYANAGTGFPKQADPAVDTITVAGLTMNGDIAMGGNSITGLANATNPTDAVTFQQLQDLQDGLSYKDPVRLATTTDLGATFNSAGGAGGTGQFTGAPTTVDGVAVAAGDRILVKDQTIQSENGIYIVTATTSTWDRASDADTSGEWDDGTTVWVGEGTVGADCRLTQNTNGPITLNTTALNFVKSGGSALFTAGDGVDITGGVISVDLDTDPGLEFNSGALRVLVDPAGAILRTAAGLAINVGDGLEILSNAVAVDLAPTNPGLTFETGDLAVLVDPAGAIVRNAAGIAAQVDGVTIGINGSNQLEVLGAGNANAVCNDLVAQASVALGDPVYMTTTNGEVAPSDAATDSTAISFVGIATAAAAPAASVEVCHNGRVNGVLTGGGFSAGDDLYIDVGGGITSTPPSTSGQVVFYLGQAVNADDMILRPQYLACL